MLNSGSVEEGEAFKATITKANDALKARTKDKRDKNMLNPTAPHVDEIALEIL